MYSWSNLKARMSLSSRSLGTCEYRPKSSYLIARCLSDRMMIPGPWLPVSPRNCICIVLTIWWPFVLIIWFTVRIRRSHYYRFTVHDPFLMQEANSILRSATRCRAREVIICWPCRLVLATVSTFEGLNPNIIPIGIPERILLLFCIFYHFKY